MSLREKLNKIQFKIYQNYIAVAAGVLKARHSIDRGRLSTLLRKESAPPHDDSNLGVLYEMQGRRVAEPAQPGIYIRDGKKIVVK